jgi:hypothetical protein
MTVKVLVTAIGQQIIADTKQIENKETNEIVGYWLTQPRLVQYSQGEDGGIGVNFATYCLVSDEAEFSLRGDHVVAILEPRDTVVEAWTKLVYPEVPETEAVTPTEETGVAADVVAEGEDASTDAPVEGLGEGEVLEVVA